MGITHQKLLFVATLVALLASSVATAENVVTATDSNFQSVVSSAPLVLAEFYAPWCGHCKKLAPEYEDAATQIKADSELASQVTLAKIDATAETAIANQVGIQGYPTIKAYKSGELAGDYGGPRHAAGIVQWVRANTGPAVTQVASAADLEPIKKANPVVVVYYGAADESDAGYKVFSVVAEAGRHSHKYAQVGASDVAAGTVKLYKHFDNGEDTFGGDLTNDDDLGEFITAMSTPLLGEMTPETYEGYVSRNLPIGWLFATPGDAKSDAAKEAVRPVAEQHVGKIVFIYIDTGKFGSVAAEFGLSGSVFPSFTIVTPGMAGKYPYDESKPLETEALKAFTQDFVDGKAKRVVKSEPVPEEPTENGLTTVVANTLGELVTDQTERDVLLEFYAPWCGHCKKLAPAYAKVASAVKDIDAIRVAKMDATANDVDQQKFTLEGFPTVLWISRDKSIPPVPYAGERTAAAILKFLKKHTKEIPKTLNLAGKVKEEKAEEL